MKRFRKDDGVLSLEAAILMPIFIGLMLLINGLFVMFMGQHIISHALLQSAKSMAFDPYSTQRIVTVDIDGDGKDDDSGLYNLYSAIGGIVFDNADTTEKWYESGYTDLSKVVKERFETYLSSDDGDGLLKTVGVKNGLKGLDFSGCTVEKGVLTIKLKFTQEYIYNVGDLASFDRELTVKVKLFEYK